MLRTALRTSYRRPRHMPQHARRSFVSSVLLSKTYEDKTVAELRSELRARGLSASGTKATLITRIQHADVRSASETPSGSNTPGPSSAVPSHHHQSQARSVSSSSSSHAQVAPSVDATPRFAPITFDVKLPDVSQPPPQPAVQVPFVPDFWDSSAKKREENAGASAASLDSSTPKIILMAGAETHIAGGPTFAMNPASNTFLPSSELPNSSSSSSSIAPRKYDGLLGDVLDDLGVPHNILSASPASSSSAGADQELHVRRTTVTRPLDEEERRGAITLLGLIFGAWVVAGLAAPSKSKSGKKGTEKAH